MDMPPYRTQWRVWKDTKDILLREPFDSLTEFEGEANIQSVCEYSKLCTKERYDD